ncbi:ATP-binding region ATPase domain protein [Alkalidesulfovibrio alkalitolerans DSM 16529]|uniref:histidine kinase n=1 Tax=Alkalidesulfovibrio alkalitolerans DSM 16529 TaxID=1121439 RepID=S7UEW2_9BACT|nr:PAS domain-containing sensor histidine kinase [Alkalidesulfovibrio alkalitolerans]EPR32354.1 ATP-binding region ATPase domain protein [Alkalidesulfovibrio alkalitolerans DSM 16529]
MDDTFPTLFAPARRADSTDLLRQYEAFKDYHCTEMVNSLPSLVVVLNATRQIVFANKSLLDLVGATDVKDILGQRPGEVLGCVHAKDTDGGCGTSSFCQECGAVRAILKSLDGVRETQECSMLRTNRGIFEALDLLVTAVPFSLSGENFTVFSVIDISHQNRRRALERIFFHDIMNTAGGLKGLLEMLRDEVPPHLREDVGVLHVSFERMLDEIASQRELMAAESGELVVRSMMLKSTDVLQSLAGVYARHDSGRGKRLGLSPDTDVVWLETDYTLLSRVMGNMVKNALEATDAGGLVELGCTDEGERVAFWVRNAQIMDDSTRLNVFKRSFSTKGTGRGLGTYSMKLLGERYLGGEVSFLSEHGKGTVFTLRLPLRRE